MTSEAIDLSLALLTALAAGFVIGTERESGEDATFAGIRTFPLIGLAGAVAMLLGLWALVVIGFSVGALIAIAYFRQSREDLGASTEIAAIITFGLGALCTADQLALATTDRLLLVAAAATATLALLSVKAPLHGLAERISESDIFATTKLLVLSVILLPVLPARQMGPWGALNPQSIGILVVLISGIGFAGYVAIRIFGARRGFGLTGLLGGLASSTAVTLTFSGRAKENEKLVPACAVAVILGSATMFPRVLIEVGAVSGSLAATALWPFVVAGVVGLGAGGGLYLWIRDDDLESDEGDLELRNPFSLSSAFKFALLFLVILVLSKGASELFADAGVYASAVLAGLADVDAISLSIAELHERGGASEAVALRGLALASASNTISKIGIATVLGGPALGMRVAAPLVLALLAGGATLALVG